MNLNGTWDFYADVGDAALAALTNNPGTITVPGAWQAQGYGETGGSIPSSVIGSDLTPAEYLRHNLTARCLYVRRVQVPAEWEGRRVFLYVRRVYRYADVTVNGKQVGDYEGFSSPFELDVTEAVRFGDTNQFVIGVDNRARKDRDTVGMANYFSNTGGFGGDVYLEARPPEWIQDVFAIPRVSDSQVHLKVTVKTAKPVLPDGMTLWGGVGPWAEAGSSRLTSPAQDRKPVIASSDRDQTNDLQIALQPARLWSPNDPFLYTATVRLLKDGQVADERQVRFGMREIVAKGNKLFLNGKPLFLAGYGDDTTYPLTGMMPWDKEVYLRQLRLMRSLGFNFVRHHSCTPHDEYFEAADEVGILVQPEASMAYVKFWPKAHGLFEKEWPQIVTAFRNHPSIWAWCMGNELFLNELPDRDTNFNAVALSPPVTKGPLKTLDVEENGVFGPPGAFPTQSHKRSNYYRDVEVAVDGEHYNLLGNAGTRRVFQEQSYELGMKFTSTRDGAITRVRYFRVPEEQGDHQGRIWDSDGRELARVAFTNESLAGWQEATLSEPLRIRANQAYVVSVNANKAYAATAPGASGFTRQDALRIVERAYQQAKELDPTRLVHTSDGGTPQRWTDVVSSGGGEQFGRKPHLLHEYGNYTCSLPDFTLIPRLNGVIRPLTYERAEAYVKQHDLERVYPRLYHSSLAMRADAQKQYLEAARLNENTAGYSFWLGIDFPESPEGCWDEGILNQFWEPKPGLTNDVPNLVGPTVLVTTLGTGSRSFYTDETKSVPLRISHYGERGLENARVSWRLKEAEEVLQKGELPGLSCGLGEIRSAGEITLPALNSDQSRFVTLECELWDGTECLTSNQWEFYSYPRLSAEAPLAGVYSEAGPVPGAALLSTNSAFPTEVRLLITPRLSLERHGEMLKRGKAAVLLVRGGGFKKIDRPAGYFLNAYGGAFGGIIEDHPVFAQMPHQGRLHLGLHQLVAGSDLLDAESMPVAMSDSAVVWGLKLTAWISQEKHLKKAVQWSEVISENKTHLALCSLDLLGDKPESRYVLGKAINYLVSGKPCSLTKRIPDGEMRQFFR